MTGKKRIRIVVDVNLWLSYAISPNGFVAATLDQLLSIADIEFVRNDEFMAEVLDVLPRTKFRKHLTEARINSVFGTIFFFTDIPIIAQISGIATDAKDDYLLALSLDAQADFLLTGDADLRELGRFGGTDIRTLREFVTLWDDRVFYPTS
jgi:uncharacterized protein